MEAESEVEILADKHRAARAVARIETEKDFVSGQVASWSKWLTASLLALNGAGALAVLNALSNGSANWQPGAIFVGGIVFALLSGVALQAAYLVLMEPLHQYDIYWSDVAHHGSREREREEELVKAINDAQRLRWLPPSLGWISGLLFLAACVSLACGHLHSPPNVKAAAKGASHGQ